MKLRNGNTHHHSPASSRVVLESNPIEDDEEKIKLERIFASDDADSENNPDTLEDGIWMNSPVDIKDFARLSKKSYKRTLGRYLY
jgi:hypothetical protein